MAIHRSDDILIHYMVGDPMPPEKRGFDKFGYVHCIAWGTIYRKGRFFSKPDEHALGFGGGGIGRAKTVVEGRKKLHDYVQYRLKEQLAEAENEVKRIKTALKTLGDDPANLERFRVEDTRAEDPFTHKKLRHN